MTTVLETKSLTKVFEIGDNIITAIKEVSLEVRRGEFVALVGPSGSGKTTLLAMLAGLLNSTAGTVFFNEQNLNEMSDRQRARHGCTRGSSTTRHFLTG